MTLGRPRLLGLSLALGAVLLGAATSRALTSVAADGRGHVLAAWGWPFVEVVDSRDGLTWSPPGGPAAYGRRPRIAGDGAGAWVAVWGGQSSDGQPAALASRSIDTGVTWSEPIVLGSESTLPRGGGSSPGPALPDVATDRSGSWVAVWNGASSLFAATSHDRGASWTAPVRVDVGGSDQSPRVATDKNGVWVLVWESPGAPTAKTDVFATRSLDDGASWSAPVLLSAPGNLTSFFGSPHVAANATGDWLATWSGPDGPYVARSTNGGIAWSAPSLIDGAMLPPGSSHRGPSVTADGDAWVIVWAASPPPHPLYSDPYHADKSSRLWIARSEDGVAWTVQPSGQLGNFPSVATEGTGHFVSLSHVTRYRPINPRFVDSFPDGFDVLASRSADGGATWSVPVRLNVNNANTCQKPSDCDDHDSCTTDACAPDPLRSGEVRCLVTPLPRLCLDGEISTRDVCDAGQCASEPRPGFGSPACSFRPELIEACAGVSVARPVRRRVDAACRLASHAIAARTRQRTAKAARLTKRANRLLMRALERTMRADLSVDANTACATALGATLGGALQEVGGSVIVATNPEEVYLPSGTVTVTLPPGDYFLFGSCTIINSRSFGDRASCGFFGTNVASAEVAVASGESRPIAMRGSMHVASTTDLTMECGQQNYFQFSSLVYARDCTVTAVATP